MIAKQTIFFIVYHAADVINNMLAMQEKACLNILDLFLKIMIPIAWADPAIVHQGLDDVNMFVLQFCRKDLDSEESMAIRLIDID